MYVDYKYYKDTYKGELDENTFNKLEPEAVSFLQYITFGKTDKAINGMYTNEIKRCVCELVETYNERDDLLKAMQEGLKRSLVGVSSESVTDHSVSFKDVNVEQKTAIENTYKDSQMNIVRKNLLRTGLLYRGL